MMNRTLIALAGLLLLSGCATSPEAPTAAAPAEPTAAEMAPATAEMSQPTAMAPTEAPAGATAPGQAMPEGARTYSIDPAQSTVSYEVGETLFREGNRFNLAVGTTNTLNGDITLSYLKPSESTVGPLTVDISTFQSDSDRRDNKIRSDWLESAKFPTVKVVPTSITGLTDGLKEGQEVTFQIVGDTTIRDTTKPLTYNVTAKLENDKLTGTATTEFKMTDFNFQPPDIAGMLKAEDAVKIKIAFTAVPN